MGVQIYKNHGSLTVEGVFRMILKFENYSYCLKINE